ncbi:flagellar motor switch protein FliN [Pseudothermotoga thermarum]|uniref:Flagellar motor switch protein FliN n=1 Tax=Pseudothermotoga thermarum DSM 5069 TaxID=688269 RepID=F7YW72_9THEM|nr:flagellar motor switch protein FliN [Pseudothermotoga thermarum]AEH51844.1 flagellar motor switch protein FliN [Pseudothermotoga thermarum DSM 5069]
MNSSDFLSQEELDALLKSLSGELSDEDVNSVKEVLNIFMGAASSALSVIVGRDVSFSIDNVFQKPLEDFLKELTDEMVIAEIKLAEGIKGDFATLIPVSLGIKIANMMMGGLEEPAVGELDEIRLSALQETFNQIVSAGVTELSTKTKKKISVESIKLSIVKKQEQAKLTFNPAEILTIASGGLTINGSKSSYFVLAPFLFFKNIYNTIHAKAEEKKPKQEEKVKVQPVQFQSFEEPKQKVVAEPSELQSKLELLYDVPLKVVVELGRARLTLKQVLELGVGSLIELDKLTGEPVDILVNGRLIARGEVVVIDESFGVRITEIVSPKQRLYSIRETNGL